MKIIVLDSDTTIDSILNSSGHHVLSLSSVEELFNSAHDDADMFILNWQTSNANLTTLIAKIRGKFLPTLPVLFIANHLTENDIVEALAAGANDFMIKPTHRELLTRINVWLRRIHPDQFLSEQLTFGRYVFDLGSARLKLADQYIDLTQKEFELALLLFQHAGRPLSRAYLLDRVWSQEDDVSSRTLDTHISRVRNKLQLQLPNDFHLVAIYGYGYQLEQPGLPHEEC